MMGLFYFILLLVAPVRAENNPSLVSQDPLMRQILHKQLSTSNGGVTTVVRVRSGQTVELSNIDPLAPLKTVVPTEQKDAPKKKDAPAKKADEQLKVLSGKDGSKKWK